MGKRVLVMEIKVIVDVNVRSSYNATFERLELFLFCDGISAPYKLLLLLLHLLRIVWKKIAHGTLRKCREIERERSREVKILNFNRRLKPSMHSTFWIVSVRLFQGFGAAFLKDLSPDHCFLGV